MIQTLPRVLWPSAPLTIWDIPPPPVLGTSSWELTVLEGLKRNMCKLHSFQGEEDLSPVEIRNDGGGKLRERDREVFRL